MTRNVIITVLFVSLFGCTQSDEHQKVSQTNMSHPELEFFNNLSGKLEIELTAPTEKIGNLDNDRATSEAEIKSLELVVDIYNPDTDTFRELTPQEKESVAFQDSQITLRGEGGDPVTHNAPNGEYFTVQDLLKVVTETERQTRGRSEWYGGVDIHHVYFEGIHQSSDGVWKISWGS